MQYPDPARFTSLKRFARAHLGNRYARAAFLDACGQGARVLDVGCGNNSPYVFKTLRPDIRYIGLDIADYNQGSDPCEYADEYLLATPEGFAEKIFAMPAAFDAVVSSHNIEHCNDPDGVLAAMLRSVKPGGRIFLAFPCEESVHFPSRRGTLNFFDDPTHLAVPQYAGILRRIYEEDFTVEVAVKRYRPVYHFLRGAVAEPLSALRKRVMYGTWALYGFETIIWAARTPAGQRARLAAWV